MIDSDVLPGLNYEAKLLAASPTSLLDVAVIAVVVVVVVVVVAAAVAGAGTEP